jgi:group I intron endonuclease
VQVVSGIYEILNTANGKRYIGQAVDFVKRWRLHTIQLHKGVHHSKHLQSAWNLYGESAFKFHELGRCAPEHLTFFEQAWMDARKPEYNLAPAAGSVLGIKRSPETRAKMSKACMGNKKLLGKKLPAVHRANIGKGNTGKFLPLAVRVKISKARTGIKQGPHSAEHRAKIGAANRGRRRPNAPKLGPQTTEHRAHISAAKKAANLLRRATA